MVYKIYSGAGNDFVMINNWDNQVPFDKQKDFTINICGEKFKQIDGVIFLDKPQGADASIRMNYYNRDGSFGAMCGNGARCIAQYAIDEGVIASDKFTLEAVDKLYKAEVKGNNIVKIHFPPPDEYKLNIKTANFIDNLFLNLHWVRVGSEHIIVFINDEVNKNSLAVNSLDNIKINEWGKEIRYHPEFQPKGTNVNFVDVISGSEIRIRTYERGVERETLACGTGIISSAIISNLLEKDAPPVNVLVQSGERLTVDFKNNNGKITDLSLEGSARKIDEGELNF